MEFLSYLISGISLGSVYAIIALGYTMVYGIAKMLNFAHGDVIMVGGYVSFCAVSYLGLPGWLSVVLAMAACTVLGVVIEGLAYKPLRQATSLAVLITAIGVSYFLQNAAQLIWGASPKGYTPLIPTTNARGSPTPCGCSAGSCPSPTSPCSPWGRALSSWFCSPSSPAGPSWARLCGPARRTRGRPSSWASTSTPLFR